MNIGEITRLKKLMKDETKPAEVRKRAAQRLLALQGDEPAVAPTKVESDPANGIYSPEDVIELKRLFWETLQQQTKAREEAARRQPAPAPPAPIKPVEIPVEVKPVPDKPRFTGAKALALRNYRLAQLDAQAV